MFRIWVSETRTDLVKFFDMVTVQMLHEWLVRLLAGEVSLQQFEEWFVPQTWNMHLDSDLDAQRLASAIELRLAEFSNEHMTEKELLRELRHLAENYSLRVSLGGQAASYTTASNSQTAPAVLHPAYV